jgi:hypothetical protein
LWHRAGFTCSSLGSLRRSFSPSADCCPPFGKPLGLPSLRQVDRAPRVRRVTFRPSPPHLHRSVPDAVGLRPPTPPRPHSAASHAVRVPRVGHLLAASFRFHLTVDTLAVRLGVPGIKASKGLPPSSHFPVGFRLPVASAVTALRAMPGARRGRDVGYPAPPAQIPACGTTAPGSCLGCVTRRHPKAPAVRSRAHVTRFPGTASGPWFARPRSPWPAPFSPPPPPALAHQDHCSGASPILWGCPTPCTRASWSYPSGSPCGPGDGSPGQMQGLPGSAQSVSVLREVSDPGRSAHPSP